MCGIAGIIPSGPRVVEPRHLTQMLASIAHRGPDDFGYFNYDGERAEHRRDAPPVPGRAILLHRRLSILDLSEAGRQPMSTRDGRYHMTLNGEIYNYKELRIELERLGHEFHTQTDTEVLLAAYVEWGSAALKRCIGMFALAILDTELDQLFLARDFFGIKPLYFAEGPHGFAFASEIKALLEVPGISREIDAERLYLCLRFALTDHGSRTVLANIRQLPAAHFAVVDLASLEVTIERYWDVSLEPRRDITFAQAAEEMRELFLDSIRLHLRSDVPIGAALSGGIDSSAIVMAMRHVSGPDLEIRAFSYIADDERISEEKWVDLIGAAANATVHKVRATHEDLVASLDDLILSQDEPFGGTSIFAQSKVFQRAHEDGIKVMLDGQGADEILGGYRYFISARLASLFRQRKFGEAATLVRGAGKLPGMSMLSVVMKSGDFLIGPGAQRAIRRVLGRELMPPWLDEEWFLSRGVSPAPLNNTAGKDVLRSHLYESLTSQSLPHLLRYEDRNSMAYSIESRVPFLTPQIATFLLSLPEEYIIAPDGTSKAVFRAAMRGIVPDAILDRRDKIGFQTPELRWLRALDPWVRNLISVGRERNMPVIDFDRVATQWQKVVAGRKRFDYQMWGWMNFIRWSEIFEVEFR